MRFIAPERTALAVDCFDQPVFDGLSGFRQLLRGPTWPSLERLDAVLQPLCHRSTGRDLSLVAQPALPDGENYERRIFQRGMIATRPGNWHDLLNALVWKRFPAIKSALNSGQVQDMDRVGLRERTRRQCAFTQFDEAGAIAVCRDPDVLTSWDRHDWTELFLGQREAWSDGRINLHVFGHALFEHALLPDMLLVSKTLVIQDDDSQVNDAAEIDQFVAAAIVDGKYLADPQDLRPLPISGIPGWDRRSQDADFYREQPCFRPLRSGRLYPAPLRSVFVEPIT